jgi:hypothetical protein
MAISVDWGTGVISIPRTDMLLVQSVPTEIRQLDIDAFRLELKDLEDFEGMTYSDTHSHNTTVDVGGVSLARVVIILDPYTITFEDGLYQVNLVGANSNISDKTNLNQVGLRSANSAGLTFSQEILDQSFTLNEVWQRLGLDANAPLVTTTSSITFDGVTIDLTGDGTTTSTATRR